MDKSLEVVENVEFLEKDLQIWIEAKACPACFATEHKHLTVDEIISALADGYLVNH